MKGLIILANGFEDVEAIATIDILKRAQLHLNVVTLYNRDFVTSSSNLKLLIEKSLKDVEYEKYDFLVLPGGAAVFKELEGNKHIEEIIKYFCDNNKLVCAICAAPLLIGKFGYFKDHVYACFPGCENSITEGTLVSNGVVRSGNFITARSMYYATDFALEIVAAVKGSEKAVEIAKQIKGL